MWKCLDHPNIVPLKGVTLNPLQLVWEWMPGGELRQHLMKYPDADRINLVGSIPAHFHMTPHFRSSCLASQKVLLISTHAVSFMEISKGCVLLLILEHHFHKYGHSQTSWWTGPETHGSWTLVSRASSRIQAQWRAPLTGVVSHLGGLHLRSYGTAHPPAQDLMYSHLEWSFTRQEDDQSSTYQPPHPLI